MSMDNAQKDLTKNLCYKHLFKCIGNIGNDMRYIAKLTSIDVICPMKGSNNGSVGKSTGS